MARNVIFCTLAPSFLATGLGAGCYHAQLYSEEVARTHFEQLGDATPETTPRHASDTSTGALFLTAEETVELAIANSLEVAAASARAQAAAAESSARHQLQNPQLRLTGVNIDEIRTNDTSMDIAVRVPIPRPGTRKSRFEGDKQAARAQESLADDTRRLLRARIYTLRALLSKLSADRARAARATKLRTALRDEVAARVEQGVATALDLARAEVALLEAKRSESAADDEHLAVHHELARLASTGRPVRFSTDASQFHASHSRPNREALLAKAIAARPELHAAHYRVGAAKADVRLAKNEAWPWFEWAQLEYVVSPDSTPASFGLGVALTLPVFNWNRREIRASTARVRQRELEHSAATVAVAGQLAAAVDRVERTSRALQELEHEILPAMKRAQDEAERAVLAGTLGPLESGEVEAHALDAERLHLEALFDHRKAWIELEAVVGAPLTMSDDAAAP